MKFRKTKKVVVISKKVDFLTEIVYLPLEFIIMLRFFEKAKYLKLDLGLLEDIVCRRRVA